MEKRGKLSLLTAHMLAITMLVGTMVLGLSAFGGLYTDTAYADTTPQAGDTVTFEDDESNNQWYILDPTTTNGYLNDTATSKASGMWLLAKTTVGSTKFTDTDVASNPDWQGSAAQSWCTSFYNGLGDWKDAVLGVKTKETSDDYTNIKYGTSGKYSLLYCNIDGTENGSADKVFFLSGKEYTDAVNAGVAIDLSDNTKAWVRSSTSRTPKTSQYGFAVIRQGSSFDDKTSSAENLARPSLNLDLTKIKLTANGTNAWIVSLKGESGDDDPADDTEKENYAVLTGEGQEKTLTFKYGVKPAETEGVYTGYEAVEYADYEGYRPPWYSELPNIKSVVFDSSLVDGTTYHLQPTSTQCWFSYFDSSDYSKYPAIETVTGAGNLDMSKVVNTQKMFDNCQKLTSIEGMEAWDMSSVTDMTMIFQLCSKLVITDQIKNWNTSNVESMYGVFCGCSSIKNLDLSGWTTSKVTLMMDMFSSCSAMETLDISGFDTSKVNYMTRMFSYAGLETIKLGKDFSFKGNNIENSDDWAKLPSPVKSVNDNLVVLGTEDVWGTGYMLSIGGYEYIEKAEGVEGNVQTGTYYTSSGLRDNWDGSTMAGTWTVYRYKDGEEPDEVYYHISADGKTVTFKYGKISSETTGTSSKNLLINTWRNNTDITKVVFDDSLVSEENGEKVYHWKPTAMTAFFSGMTSLTDIEGAENVDTSNVIDLHQLCKGCTSLESVDFSSWDVSKVTGMNMMFQGCTALKTADLGWDTGDEKTQYARI